MKFDSNFPYRVVWKGKSRVLLEEAPRYRLYHFLGREFWLPIPYVHYLIGPNQGSQQGRFYEGGRNVIKIHVIACSPVPVRADDQALYHLPLPNVSDYNTPCYSVTQWCGNREGIPRHVASAIDEWWWESGNFDWFPWHDPFIISLMTERERRWDYRDLHRLEIAYAIFSRWEKLTPKKLLKMPFRHEDGFEASLLTPKTMTGSKATKVVSA